MHAEHRGPCMIQPRGATRANMIFKGGSERTPSFKAIDLFSGCGGMTVGLRRAGIAVVGAIEIDHLAGRTYAANHPHVHLWNEDIRAVSVTRNKRRLGLKK